MSIGRSNAFARSLLGRLEQEYDKSYGTPAISTWVPSPEVSRKCSILKPEAKLPKPFLRELRSTFDDVGDEVASISTIGLGKNEHPSPIVTFEDARFGFAGAENRVFSVNIPAEGEAGRKNPLASFDLEYDSEQPDRLTVSLMMLDEDGFIQTVQKSIAFPTSVIADLLNKRKATPEEISAWQDAYDKD